MVAPLYPANSIVAIQGFQLIISSRVVLIVAFHAYEKDKEAKKLACDQQN